MSEETSTEVTEQTTETTAADSIAEMVNESQYDFILDKYKADGRDEQSALIEQAKGYSELQNLYNSKMKDFTGAPDSYELSLSEEISEKMAELDIAFDTEDPLFSEFQEVAKDMGMSQEGFNKMMGVFASVRMSEDQARAEQLQDELKGLGDAAEQRINNVLSWASKNLGEDQMEAFKGLAQTAEQFQVIESLISMTRSAPVSPESVAPAARADRIEEVKQMQFAKDENGNRRLATDPEFRARYNALAREVYGTEDYQEVIG